MVLAISWGYAAVWVLEEKEREQESWITDKGSNLAQYGVALEMANHDSKRMNKLP